MTAQARSVPLAVAACGPTTPAVTVAPGTVLSGREATLRSAAIVWLAGIALVQAIGLRSVFVEGGRFAVLSLAVMMLCVGLGLVLAAAPAAAAGPVWRLVAAAAVVVLAGWALPRAFAVPGLEEARGAWASAPGAVCAGLAAACLVAAGLARRPTRPPGRVLVTALAVVVALAPGVGVLLIGLGPGAAGGEQSLTAAHVHGHGHLSPAAPEGIRYRPGSARIGGHYVVSVALPARDTPLGLGLVVATALAFTAGAVAHLRRRTAGAEGPPA